VALEKLSSSILKVHFYIEIKTMLVYQTSIVVANISVNSINFVKLKEAS